MSHGPEVLMDVNSTGDYYMKCLVSDALEAAGFTVTTYPVEAFRAALRDGQPRVIVHFHGSDREKAEGAFLAVVVADQVPGDYITLGFSRWVWRVLASGEWRFDGQPAMMIRDKARELLDQAGVLASVQQGGQR